jgi:hypothetical protein
LKICVVHNAYGKLSGEEVAVQNLSRYLRQKNHSVVEFFRDSASIADSGLTEIQLLGQNVNSYLDPTGRKSFAELLAAVGEVSGIRRVRFTTSHPRDFGRDIVEAHEVPGRDRGGQVHEGGVAAGAGMDAQGREPGAEARIQFLPLSRKRSAPWTNRQVCLNQAVLRCRQDAIQIFQQALFLCDTARHTALRA